MYDYYIPLLSFIMRWPRVYQQCVLFYGVFYSTFRSKFLMINAQAISNSILQYFLDTNG